MSRGKQPFVDTPRMKRLSLPGSLVDEVEELLHDPVRRNVRYGAFAALVTELLEKWVDDRRKK